jgi:selenide,water dikinase
LSARRTDGGRRVTELVLVGGGHSHVEVLRRFALDPLRDARVVLVSPARYTPYSGMLPGLVAGHYTFREAHIDLESLARFAKAAFLCDAVVALDPSRRRLQLASGREIAYDLASVDIGSTPARAGVAGAEHAIAVKPVEDFLARVDRLEALALEKRLASVAVIGGGAAGVEILLALQYRLSARGHRIEFSIVTDTPTILPGHRLRVRRIFERVLTERGVAVHAGTGARRIDRSGVETADGTHIAADATVLATSAAPATWPRDAGLAVDGRAFIRVGETLQSVSHSDVFAAGDIATIENHPRPKSGVYAVRQGPPLAENLLAAIEGRPLSRFVPQKEALALISTGDKYAVASRGPLVLEGAWIWKWKDRIDRGFMARYHV